MNSELVDKIQAARAKWPALEVSERTFLVYIRQRMPHAVKLAHLSDLYLACACSQRSARAIALFQTHFLVDLKMALVRLRPSDEFVEDVQQQMMEKLFVPSETGAVGISNYRGTGPLKGWIRVMALGTALNMRQQGRKEFACGHHELIDAKGLTDDAELAAIRSRHRTEFRAALTLALVALSSRDRNILRLHYLSGMSLDQIGAAYGVHRATAARWLASTRQAILENLHQRLAAQLKISRSQLESLLALIRSQLDVSLRRLLGSSSGPATQEA